MKSYLIKDTTVEERIELIKQWLPDDALEECDIDLWDMYDPYIKGKMEIQECNAAFKSGFYEESDFAGEQNVPCAMGTPKR